MILNESLWPGMTRKGFGHKTCVPVRPHDRHEFPVTSEGLWLPLARVAIKEFEMAKEVVPEKCSPESLARAAFSKIECDEDTGCWVSESISDDEEHTLALWDIAEVDMGGEAMNLFADKENLHVCDTPHCMNARHYDFTHRIATRDKLIDKPNYQMYRTLEDGSIMCLWEEATGVVLPSVEESIQIFRDLQKRCVPYIDNPKLAPITANGMSKITIDAITGCMPVRMYYTSSKDEGMNYMYDGYGRIGPGPAIRRPGESGANIMAHRVVYRATKGRLKKGWEVNHECGFRPCANPEHLSRMTRSENIRHMYGMKSAREWMQSGHSQLPLFSEGE